MDAGSYTLPHCALQPSPSFFSPRSRNTITLASTSTTAPPPYVTHLSSLSPTSLLAVTSDGQVSVVDKNTLRRTDGFRHGKEGAFTNVAKLQTQAAGPSGTIWGVTDRDGKCSVFDARSGNRNGLDTKMEITTPTSSPLLSLAFSSSSTPLLALGHELASIDAPIYTYDLRQTSAPVLTYDQSHSDDVTFLEFSSKNSTVADTEYLLSGSTDGLMTVYDLSKGSDEDEAVVSAANTGSSLARGGWGGAAPEITAQAGAPKPPSGDPDEQPGIYKGLGSAWAVSDMQTIGIWDAESTDPLLPPISALPSTALLPSSSAWQSRKWESDYIIDAAPVSAATAGLNMFVGDQSGSFALLNVPSPLPLPSPFDLDEHLKRITSTQRWTLQAFFPSLSDSAQGGHEDIVRCVQVDEFSPSVLWSGGEDGKVVAWDVGDGSTQSTPGTGAGAATMATPLEQTRVGGGGGGGASSRRNGGTPMGTSSRYKPYG